MMISLLRWRPQEGERDFSAAARVASWIPTPCNVTASGEGKRYNRGYYSVQYTYEFKGKTYEGHSVNTGSAWRPGTEGICLVNPQNPAESIVDPDIYRPAGKGCIGCELIFIVVVLWPFLFAIKSLEKLANMGSNIEE